MRPNIMRKSPAAPTEVPFARQKAAVLLHLQSSNRARELILARGELNGDGTKQVPERRGWVEGCENRGSKKRMFTEHAAVFQLCRWLGRGCPAANGRHATSP